MGALTGAGLGLVDLHQEDDDGQQVGDVPQDAEDVHGAGGGSSEVKGVEHFLQAGWAKAGRLFPPKLQPSKRSPPAQLSFFPQYGALSSGGEKFRLLSLLAASAFPLPGAQAGRLPCLLFPSRWIFSLPPAQGLPLPAPGRKLGFVPWRAPGRAC